MKYTIFLLLLFFALATQAQIPSYLPTNGLVAWYPFNGNANDESGNGNNGTVNGATLTTDRFGNAGKAYLLSGSPQYLSLPSGNSTNLNITGDFTVSLWIKTNASQGGLLICGDNVYSPYPGYFSGINGGNIGLGKVGISTNGIWYSSNSVINNNQWRSIIYVLNSGIFKIYIDGINENTFSNVLPPSSWSGNRVIGCRSDLYMNNNTNYIGSIDDIAIWNRALSAQEIQSLYTGVPLGDTGTVIATDSSRVGINVSNPQRNLHIRDVMRLEPRSGAPANPGEGDIYYDAILKKLRVYNGAAWMDCW